MTFISWYDLDISSKYLRRNEFSIWGVAGILTVPKTWVQSIAFKSASHEENTIKLPIFTAFNVVFECTNVSMFISSRCLSLSLSLLLHFYLPNWKKATKRIWYLQKIDVIFMFIAWANRSIFVLLIRKHHPNFYLLWIYLLNGCAMRRNHPKKIREKHKLNNKKKPMNGTIHCHYELKRQRERESNMHSFRI